MSTMNIILLLGNIFLVFLYPLNIGHLNAFVAGFVAMGILARKYYETNN